MDIKAMRINLGGFGIRGDLFRLLSNSKLSQNTLPPDIFYLLIDK